MNIEDQTTARQEAINDRRSPSRVRRVGQHVLAAGLMTGLVAGFGVPVARLADHMLGAQNNVTAKQERANAKMAEEMRVALGGGTVTEMPPHDISESSAWRTAAGVTAAEAASAQAQQIDTQASNDIARQNGGVPVPPATQP